MTLEDLTNSDSGFDDLSHVERIKLFAWFLHSQKGLEHFMPVDIARGYRDVHAESPQNIPALLLRLVNKRPADMLKNRSGYRLEKRVREALNAKHGQRTITVQVTRLLRELPSKVPNLAERTFLDEALKCFEGGAFRVSIVMAWNLAYHHLCDFILRKHLADFNARWPAVLQGHHNKGTKAITKMDDFSDLLKESEVLKIAKSASIITNDQAKILDDKLGRRNSAAHPSGVKIEQLQAEEFIRRSRQEHRAEARVKLRDRVQ